jgi:hypothetical protein
MKEYGLFVILWPEKSSRHLKSLDLMKNPPLETWNGTEGDFLL